MSIEPIQVPLVIGVELVAGLGPGIVAYWKDHPKKVLILVLGILLGWTLIVPAALVFWAMRNKAPAHG